MKEKEIEKLNELRIYAFAAPHILPLIERRKKSANARLISAYRVTGDLIGPTAELAVLEDMEQEILRKCKELDNIEQK